MTLFLWPRSLSVNNHQHLWPSFRAPIIGPVLLRHHWGGLVFVYVCVRQMSYVINMPESLERAAFCGSAAFRIAVQLETGMELKWSVNWTVFCFNFQAGCHPKFWNCIGIDLVCAKVILFHTCVRHHGHTHTQNIKSLNSSILDVLWDLMMFTLQKYRKDSRRALQY